MFDFVIIQWEKLNSLPEFGALIVAIVGVAFAVYYIFLRKKEQSDEDIIKNYQVSIDSYKERLEIVEKETQACHEQHNETKQMVKHLQGQLDAYSKMVLIPGEFLKELQRNQLEIIKLLKANKKKG